MARSLGLQRLGRITHRRLRPSGVGRRLSAGGRGPRLARAARGACGAGPGSTRPPPRPRSILRANTQGGLLKAHTRVARATRVRDTAKISGCLLGGHCLRSDLAAELRDLALDLVGEARELLGAGPNLLHELRRELSLLVEK